jgi:signal transduction histidine kinase
MDPTRIFQRFGSNGSWTPGGLGIGLYVAHQVAKAHRGELEVESQPGAGARFTLRLPLEPDRTGS